MTNELPLKATADYRAMQLRFFDKFFRSEDGCWYWTAATDPNGYGRFGIRGKQTRLAHHVSYYLFKGEDPQGRVVRHTCDHPGCVNPDHLKVGTHADNVQDKVRKGRHSGARLAGEANGRTRLTDEQASAVRSLLGCGFSIAACARIFGTSPGPILAIRNQTRPASETTNWKALK